MLLISAVEVAGIGLIGVGATGACVGDVGEVVDVVDSVDPWRVFEEADVVSSAEEFAEAPPSPVHSLSTRLAIRVASARGADAALMRGCGTRAGLFRMSTPCPLLSSATA